MKKKILKCCMVSALLLTSTVYAQQIQNIRGMVADTDGKALIRGGSPSAGDEKASINGRGRLF